MFGELMFQPNFTFFNSKTVAPGVYKIPKCAKIAEYHEFISDLPTSDNPEAFGLHPNADITYVPY